MFPSKTSALNSHTLNLFRQFSFVWFRVCAFTRFLASVFPIQIVAGDLSVLMMERFKQFIHSFVTTVPRPGTMQNGEFRFIFSSFKMTNFDCVSMCCQLTLRFAETNEIIGGLRHELSFRLPKLQISRGSFSYEKAAGDATPLLGVKRLVPKCTHLKWETSEQIVRDSPFCAWLIESVSTY